MFYPELIQCHNETSEFILDNRKNTHFEQSKLFKNQHYENQSKGCLWNKLLRRSIIKDLIETFSVSLSDIFLVHLLSPLFFINIMTNLL